ncbi:hypothetical protein [Pseudomonas sp. NFACC08-1]|uniref:hypothetical protein n=1 Tax=Pseudomonas sp. NFACC08-1 TaxID=1566238 RepID=UPI00147F03D5|nr:hypothetical protein [Pseudomonas sp. NFACC08-1]
MLRLGQPPGFLFCAKAPTKRKTANRPKADAPSLVSKDGMAPLKRRKPEAPAAE